MRTIPILLFLAILPAEALANDGVLEINQTCAAQTGCFSGDTPGFPVTIVASGSYRLTSNLSVPDANTNGIQFSGATVSNVSIDLGGFAIRGPVVCSGAPLACAPSSGTGNGIIAFSASNAAISVRNGSITGMGNYGIVLGDQGSIRHLRVASNRFFGIFASGIGSLVTDNTVYQNGARGIHASSGSLVSRNASYANGAEGIYVNSGSTVTNNTATTNGDDGIETNLGCTVQGNSVGGNAGFGLRLGAQSAYRGNTIQSDFGTYVFSSSAVNLGSNSCGGATTCP